MKREDPRVSTRSRRDKQMERHSWLDLEPSSLDIMFKNTIRTFITMKEDMFQLRIEPVDQTSSNNNLRMTIIERQSIKTDQFSVDALGACTQTNDGAGS